MKISIIVPIYNSAQSLNVLNEEIDTYFLSRGDEFEKIYVNDGSIDSSGESLQELAKADYRVKVIELEGNFGQQNAIFCGMGQASGDVIITMDDDLQHDVSQCGRLIEAIEKGQDLVYGIYTNRDTPSFRHWGSRLTAQFFRRNYPAIRGLRVSSFRAFNRELLEASIRCPYRFIYLSGIMLSRTEKIGNIEVEQRERRYGQSGYNLKKLIKLYMKLNFYYSRFSIIEGLKPKGGQYAISYTINL